MFAFAVSVMGGCEAETALAPELAEEQAWVVYGSDDRREPYEFTQAVVPRISDAVAAMVWDSDLTLVNGSAYQVSPGSTLGVAQNLCPGERFADQPTPASCTAFFVGEDLLVTAGHCILGRSCSSTSFVFGYRMSSATSVRDTVPLADVYQCAEVISATDSYPVDYAVIRVDRPVTGRAALPLRQQGAVTAGERVAMFGHPSGLPQKIDLALVEPSSDPSFFEVGVDAFGGNSGSPLINTATREVEGVLVRGNQDYRWTGSCYEVNTCSTSGCPGFEDATRSTVFASIVANASIPDACGNGVCEVGESCDGRSGTTLCASDCDGVQNGPPRNRFCYVNGVCEGDGCP